MATFPDLIITFNPKTARPIISAEIKEKEEVCIITVPSQYLPLGSGVKDQNLLERIGKLIKKQIIKK